MASEEENSSPGTAKPARTRKAACGIRFDEDELREGIDFSGAEDLKPAEAETESSASEKHRQTDGHP